MWLWPAWFSLKGKAASTVVRDGPPSYATRLLRTKHRGNSCNIVPSCHRGATVEQTRLESLIHPPICIPAEQSFGLIARYRAILFGNVVNAAGHISADREFGSPRGGIHMHRPRTGGCVEARTGTIEESVAEDDPVQGRFEHLALQARDTTRRKADVALCIDGQRIILAMGQGSIRVDERNALGN